ncbi:MAG: type II secretion system protein GspG [Acidobacteriota bacterium]
MENQIRTQVRTFDGASLDENQVEVTNLRELGDHATAEIQITTGVKLVKKDGKWLIEEFRIGDRRWEKAEHILALINEKRTTTTLDQMDLISEGIERYARLNQRIPQVFDSEELATLLFPRFQSQFTPTDGWANPFSYQPRGEREYELRSLGPDGRFGTPDDLIARTQ